MKLESISAFFPAYNDQATIGGLVEKVFQVLAETGREFEVLVVDDGSRDQTPAVLQGLQSRYGDRFRVVRHAANRGYGAALRSGMEAARKDLVFYTDGDGQYDPGELKALLARLEPGVGLVNGYKTRRSDPPHRIVIGKIYNATVRWLFGISLRDVDCDFRLIRRSWLEQARLQSDTGVICVEMAYKLERLGCRAVEVAVSHYPRVAGRSQFFRWRSVLATLGQLSSLYFTRWAPSAAPESTVEVHTK